jgi:hypothetical protein
MLLEDYPQVAVILPQLCIRADEERHPYGAEGGI